MVKYSGIIIFFVLQPHFNTSISSSQIRKKNLEFLFCQFTSVQVDPPFFSV